PKFRKLRMTRLPRGSRVVPAVLAVPNRHVPDLLESAAAQRAPATDPFNLNPSGRGRKSKGDWSNGMRRANYGHGLWPHERSQVAPKGCFTLCVNRGQVELRRYLVWSIGGWTNGSDCHRAPIIPSFYYSSPL